MIAVEWLDRSALPTVRRAAARALLTRTARSAGLETVGIDRGAGGKPVVTVPGYDYSMSHSGTLSVCAVADTPVGVDVEMFDVPRRVRLAADPPTRFFTERERAEIAIDPDAVLRIFTMKESWVKRDGRGLGIGIGRFDREELARRHPDVGFTEVALPGAVCTVCHRTGETFVVRRARPSAEEISAADRVDRRERAACYG